jgi:hypothetical protein
MRLPKLLAQAPATLQVADHCFGYHLDRVRVLGPLQLFLARRQVGKEIL